MVKERQNITGTNCLKGVSGRVIVNEKGIKDSWKEYMQKLTNEENEWDHRTVKWTWLCVCARNKKSMGSKTLCHISLILDKQYIISDASTMSRILSAALGAT